MPEEKRAGSQFIVDRLGLYLGYGYDFGLDAVT
jgi:hypothetical protein